MDRDPIRTAVRAMKRERRLGPGAACLRCGLTEPAALIPASRRLLDAHHVVGRAHDGRLIVALCRNCHALLTDRLREAGVSMRPAETRRATLRARLRAMAVHCRTLADAFEAWAADADAEKDDR